MILDFYYTAIRNVSQSTKFNLHSGNIIEWLDTEQTQPTDSEIQAEITKLQAVYDAQEYARKRKTEYDQLNQWELQFDDQRDGTSTWVDAINAIKNRNPK